MSFLFTFVKELTNVLELKVRAEYRDCWRDLARLLPASEEEEEKEETKWLKMCIACML